MGQFVAFEEDLGESQMRPGLYENRGRQAQAALLGLLGIVCVRWLAGCGGPEAFHYLTPAGHGGQVGAGGVAVLTGHGGTGGPANGGGGGAGAGGGSPDAGSDTGGDAAGAGGANDRRDASGGGAGGVGGGGGLAGSGGSDGGTSACNPGYSPATVQLSDFGPTTWNPSTGKWGLPTGLTGTIVSYNGSAAGTAWNPIRVSVAAANPALVMSGNVGVADYAGGAMAFDQCVHTTNYTGLTFTLSGTTAGCDLLFEVQTFSQQSVANRGACNTAAMTCYQFPKLKVTVSAAPIVVRFADLANTGQPTTAAGIASEMVGLQWQLQSPAPPAGATQQPCTSVNLSVDDVAFTTN